MTSLRFLVDMNLSPKTVPNLQQHGWDIIRVSQILKAGTQPHSSFEDAYQNMRVLEAISKSVETGEKVRIIN